MKTRNSDLYFGYSLSLQEELAGVVATEGSVESLRGRMEESERQALC
jgi:hypothetical protein